MARWRLGRWIDDPPPHPDPRVRTLADPIYSTVWQELRSQETGSGVPPYDQDQHALERTWGAHPIVTACIWANAMEASSIPIKLYDKGTDEEIEEHEILDVLADPNTKMDGETLWMWLLLQIENFGNGYLTIDLAEDGQTPELWPMPASRTRIKFTDDPKDPIDAYTYHAYGTGTLFGGTGQMTITEGGPISILDPEDVIHARYPNPWAADYFFGLSKIRQLWHDLRRHHLADQWIQKFFEQGAVIPYAIEAISELSDDAYQRLNETVRDRIVGLNNFHKPFLAENARVRKVGSAVGDTQVTDLETLAERRTLAVMGTPPIALGFTEANFATAREQTRVWYKKTIKPLLKVALGALNRSRFVMEHDSLELRPDFSGVEALQKDRNAMAQADAIYLGLGVPDPDNPERLAEALAIKEERASKFLERMGPPGAPPPAGGENEGPEDADETEPEDRTEEQSDRGELAVAVFGDTAEEVAMRAAIYGLQIGDAYERDGRQRADVIGAPEVVNSYQVGELLIGEYDAKGLRNGSD